MSSFLVVDDEASISWGLSRLIRGLGHDVETASSAEQGLERAARKRPDAVLLDVRLPGMDGLTAMPLFRQHVGDAPLIVMTAFGDLPTALAAVNNGAFDYLVKPFELSEVRSAVERAVRKRGDAPAATRSPGQGMLGETPAMQAAFKRIALAARSAAPVLLRGETGTGKRLAAATIHEHSDRRSGPFVHVNVAALSPALAEAELFGHAEGATGAWPARRGLAAQAEGGVLFLDEAADLPLAAQARLLHALEHSTSPNPPGAAPAGFRVIASTERHLPTLIRAGAFRADLYCKLVTLEIYLPPLRNRRADIALLAEHFAARLRGAGVAAASIAAETHEELTRRPWHGNVRELLAAVEHALTLARAGQALPAHLPPPLPRFDEPVAEGSDSANLTATVGRLAESLLADARLTGEVYERFLAEVEPTLLAAALHTTGRRCAPAARALGLHRTTLKRKLDQYGIVESGGDDQRLDGSD